MLIPILGYRQPLEAVGQKLESRSVNFALAIDELYRGLD